MNRSKLIKELYELRRGGWESPVLPYGLPFREESATDWELENHLRKIRKHRKEVIESRISLVLQIAAMTLFVALVIIFTR